MISLLKKNKKNMGRTKAKLVKEEEEDQKTNNKKTTKNPEKERKPKRK